MDKIPSYKNIKSLKGKRVLLRLDLNVPLINKKISDTFRIEKALPTITYFLRKGAKVIIISHLGKGKESLLPVASILKKKIPLVFVPEISGACLDKALSVQKNGTAILLENVRFNKGEESNDPVFAKKLASLGDVFVNDAFGTMHRKHASVVGVTHFIPSFLGPLAFEEVKQLSRAFSPKRPFLFILGGAKFDTKLPLLKSYGKKADTVFVGGALANNFFKELGYQTGKSLTEKIGFSLEPLLRSQNIIIPTDVVVRRGKKWAALPLSEVQKNDFIGDIGPISTEILTRLIARAKLVVMNGPLGFYEGGFTEGTTRVFKALSTSKAISIIGGGDTAAVAEEYRKKGGITFVSTGGGASIDLLVQGTLPALEALKKNSLQKGKKGRQ